MKKTAYVVKTRYAYRNYTLYEVYSSLKYAKRAARKWAGFDMLVWVIKVSDPYKSSTDDLDFEQKTILGVSTRGKMRWRFAPHEDIRYCDGFPFSAQRRLAHIFGKCELQPPYEKFSHLFS